MKIRMRDFPCSRHFRTASNSIEMKEQIEQWHNDLESMVGVRFNTLKQIRDMEP